MLWHRKKWQGARQPDPGPCSLQSSLPLLAPLVPMPPSATHLRWQLQLRALSTWLQSWPWADDVPSHSQAAATVTSLTPAPGRQWWWQLQPWAQVRGRGSCIRSSAAIPSPQSFPHHTHTYSLPCTSLPRSPNTLCGLSDTSLLWAFAWATLSYRSPSQAATVTPALAPVPVRA